MLEAYAEPSTLRDAIQGPHFILHSPASHGEESLQHKIENNVNILWCNVNPFVTLSPPISPRFRETIQIKAPEISGSDCMI